MGEETCKFPILSISQKRFLLLGNEEGVDRAALKKDILDAVKEHSMLPYYEEICKTANWTPDEALVAGMKKTNDEELEKIEAKIKDAEENLGDVEVRDGLAAKADFFNRIGDKEQAVKSYQVTFDKTVGIGGKLDNILTCIRMAFFFDDKEMSKKEIERAKAELSKGGDWERKNKLKVYEGVQLMILRDFKGAALLFLDAMPTFTATECVEFKDFVFYTVVLSMVALDRAAIRKRVIHCPEILSVIHQIPHLKEFLESFYYCKYKDFMEHFVYIIDHVRRDRYMSRHVRHFMRIMRLNAYRQFLASYKSVTIQAMADNFGVSSDFIDGELASFITSGKLTCKIDKVGGVVESNEADARSQVYSDIIKQGDLLLNRMQRLSGAIDM